MRPRRIGVTLVLLGVTALCCGQERGTASTGATSTDGDANTAGAAAAIAETAANATGTGAAAASTAPTAAPSPLLDAAIEIARGDHPRLDADAVRAEIDRLARVYRELAPADAPARRRAEAFATLLFEREGFSSVDDLESSAKLHIDSVLAGRRGYCLSLSVVALCVAAVVEEPLFGVASPNHFFVRFDDGDLRVNLELTRRGREVTDAELRERLGDFLHDDSIYLANLEPEQVRAVLLHNRGFVALAEDRLDRAERDLTAAAATLPGLPEVHRNLGVLWGERERWDRAVTAFERALELYPGDVDALLNLALCRHQLGDLDQALEDLAVVLVLDPGRDRARHLRTDWEHERDRRLGGWHPPDEPPAGLEPGLLGTYHRGTRLDGPVLRRVDTDFDFDWGRSRPAAGLPRDGFSVRWEGWLRAPRLDSYTLFVVANDGVRIAIGEQLVVDHWRDSGYSSWTGAADVELSAGWHPLRVEYYDRRDNARLFWLLSRDGDEYPLKLSEHLFHQPAP